MASIMQENIASVLERGEAIDRLVSGNVQDIKHIPGG